MLAIIASTTLMAITSNYTKYEMMNCYAGHGGINIDSGPQHTLLTVAQCKAHCDATSNCFCVVITSNATEANGKAGHCWRRSYCNPKACGEEAKKYNTFIKPGAPTPPPPNKCIKSSNLKRSCIYDPHHLLRSTDCGKSSCESECCSACADEKNCTAWSHVAGFGRFACNLYNRTANSLGGELRSGPSRCTSAGVLPPPPPVHPPASTPPAPGPPCKDCPNILLMFTDDQDLILGGWEGLDWEGPMTQTRKSIAQQGATATQWRIHTPICAPSRSSMQSGRYLHNIKNDDPTPYWSVTSGAIGHLDLTRVWPYMFAKTLREEKG